MSKLSDSNIRKRLIAWLNLNPFATFVLMGVSFLSFGLLSANVVYLLSANLHLFSEVGVAAIADGALLQLLQILLSGYGGVFFYVLFKACERILVEQLTSK